MTAANPSTAFQAYHQKHQVYQATIKILQHESLSKEPKTILIIQSLVKNDAVIPIDLMNEMILYYLKHDFIQIWADLIGVEYLTFDGKIKEVNLEYLNQFNSRMKCKVSELILNKNLARQVDF